MPKSPTADPLTKSVHTTIRGVPHKSCPCCSLAAGRIVFLPTDRFGERRTHSGSHTLQAWCIACRSAQSRAKRKLDRPKKKRKQDQARRAYRKAA